MLCQDRFNAVCLLKWCVSCTTYLYRAASIPIGKAGTSLQMKLVYSDLAPILLLFLQWMDCSCSCLLSDYLNLFHVVVYKVGFCFPADLINKIWPFFFNLIFLLKNEWDFIIIVLVIGFLCLQVRSDGRPNISSYGRKATISQFYSM